MKISKIKSPKNENNIDNYGNVEVKKKMVAEKEKFVIATLESWSGMRTLKQHIFIETDITVNYTDDKYKGNKSLCSKMAAYIHFDDFPMPLQEIENEPIDKKTICKTCERIARKKGLIT